MKEKVLELQQMFIDRIEVGDFDVVDVDKNGYVDILIDGYMFRFNRNGQSLFDNFMMLRQDINLSFVVEAIKKGVKQAKIKELSKLKQEIQEL